MSHWMASPMNTIRDMRKLRGLSQGELADAIGCDRTFISSIERSGRRPALRTLERVAEALDCAVVDLLPHDYRRPPSKGGGA